MEPRERIEERPPEQYEIPPNEQVPSVSSSAPRRERSRKGISLSGPLILIALGGALLANNLGIVTLNWSTIAQFWPVLLIVLGLDMVLGRRSVAGSVVIGIVALALVAGVALVSNIDTDRIGTVGAPRGNVEGEFSVPLERAQHVDLEINSNIMAVKIEPLDDGGNVLQGHWDTLAAYEPEVDTRNDGDSVSVTIRQPEVNNQWPGGIRDEQSLVVQVPEGVTVDITINSDFGRTTADLATLDVTSLAIDAGSGEVEITLPTVGTMDVVEVHADFGRVILTAPEDSALDIDTVTVTAGSGEVNVTLPASGTIGSIDVHADFGTIKLDTAGDPADLTLEDDLLIEAGSGEINVELPGQGDYEVEINADFGSVEVVIPDTLEASVSVSRDFGRFDVNNDRLDEVDDNEWETSEYGSTRHQAEIQIDAGTGSITID